MFGNENENQFDPEIQRTLDEMGAWPQTDQEYQTRLDTVERLQKMRLAEKPERLSRNTMFSSLMASGTMIAILIYENKHVIQTRGFQFLTGAKNLFNKS